MSDSINAALVAASSKAHDDIRRAQTAFMMRLADAREAGVPWADLAAPLGVSRQALHRKWSGLVAVEIAERAHQKLVWR